MEGQMGQKCEDFKVSTHRSEHAKAESFTHKTEGQPIKMHTKLRVNPYNCTETEGQPIQMHDIERLSNLKLADNS